MGNKFTNEAQRQHWNEYNKNYAKKKYKSYNIKLDKEHDMDVIDYITKYGSISEVVRTLVRKELGTGK